MKTFKIFQETELDEASALSRAQLERPDFYKRSLEVYKILKKNGYRLGAQGDTLVRNILKKKEIGRDPKKAAAKIMKDYPGLKPGQAGRVEEVEESTKEYAKSLDKIANDRTLKMLTKSERENLKKIADLLAKEVK